MIGLFEVESVARVEISASSSVDYLILHHSPLRNQGALAIQQNLHTRSAVAFRAEVLELPGARTCTAAVQHTQARGIFLAKKLTFDTFSDFLDLQSFT